MWTIATPRESRAFGSRRVRAGQLDLEEDLRSRRRCSSRNPRAACRDRTRTVRRSRRPARRRRRGCRRAATRRAMCRRSAPAPAEEKDAVHVHRPSAPRSSSPPATTRDSPRTEVRGETIEPDRRGSVAADADLERRASFAETARAVALRCSRAVPRPSRGPAGRGARSSGRRARPTRGRGLDGPRPPADRPSETPPGPPGVGISGAGHRRGRRGTRHQEQRRGPAPHRGPIIMLGKSAYAPQPESLQVLPFRTVERDGMVRPRLPAARRARTGARHRGSPRRRSSGRGRRRRARSTSRSGASRPARRASSPAG